MPYQRGLSMPERPLIDNLTPDITFDDRDEYQRRPVAENVIRLLTSDARVSPMVIDGGWGTGKTEFCFKLINLIKEKDFKYKAIYVDAFSADHADEPLVTILAAILKLLPENKKKALINKALPVIRFGVKTTLKAGVSWLLKQDAADLADDFDNDIKKASDEAINQSIKTLLNDHLEAEKSIATLKEALETLGKDSPVIVFIDELDRCRPDFSVSLLESIKHVFNVDGVHFVLLANLNQLRASINHRYGIAVDAQRYLDKFIGFSFFLPDKLNRGRHDETIASICHARNKITLSHLLAKSALLRSDDFEFLELLVRNNRLSLRETETFSRYLEIYQVLTNEKGLGQNVKWIYSMLRVLGVFVFCFKPSLMHEFEQGVINVPGLARLVGKVSLLNFSSGNFPDFGDILTAVLASDTNYKYPDFKPKNQEELDTITQNMADILRGMFTIPTIKLSEAMIEAAEVLKLGKSI